MQNRGLEQELLQLLDFDESEYCWVLSCSFLDSLVLVDYISTTKNKEINCVVGLLLGDSFEKGNQRNKMKNDKLSIPLLSENKGL